MAIHQSFQELPGPDTRAQCHRHAGPRDRRDAADTAGCNKLKEVATPGWRISLRTYSRQYEPPGGRPTARSGSPTSRRGDGEWLQQRYQLHGGTYLGTRHHIRAFAPSERPQWTALQAHSEHWDWFRLRHIVTDVRGTATLLADDSRTLGGTTVERNYARDSGPLPKGIVVVMLYPLLTIGLPVAIARRALELTAWLAVPAAALGLLAGRTVSVHRRLDSPASRCGSWGCWPHCSVSSDGRPPNTGLLYHEGNSYSKMSGRRGDGGVSRRSVLTGLTAGVAATSGCLNRLRALVGRDEPDTVSLSIKTLPVDEDPYAIAIARELSAWFDTAGIDTSVQPMTAEELYQQTLINHNFDVFVGQFPGRLTDPDALYSLLHSTYSVEPGLQNPFGYTNLLMDDLLEQQRRESGSDRANSVEQIQRQLTDVAPFTVVGFPEVIRAARTDRFTGWTGAFYPSPVNLLSLNRVDESATTLRATTPDSRPMANLNPLMTTYRRSSDITDLLYDPLVRPSEGAYHPWVATDWTWTGEDPLELAVTLREGLLWHDGEDLTAEDAAFTYDLLGDTSLGELDQPVPTLRFRGRSSLVSSATAVDDRTLTLQFADSSQEVAPRALTVPLLPEHIWSDRSTRADLTGINVDVTTTEALVTDAIPPVGSGPLEYASSSGRQLLVLEQFDDHFLRTDEETGAPGSLVGGPPFDRFELEFVGSDASAVNLIATGDADVTALGVDPDLTSTIGAATDVSLTLGRSNAFYFAGFNTRRSPLTNPRFRELLTRLLDRPTLAESVFDGYVDLAVSPLDGTTWLPAELAWSESDPTTEFLGSDGVVDPEQAETAFRAAGYRYNEQGRLIR